MPSSIRHFRPRPLPTSHPGRNHGEGRNHRVSGSRIHWLRFGESDRSRIARVHFPEDEETGRVGRERDAYRHDRRMSRHSSIGSLSIHDNRGVSRTVQPETALPITYRTL